MGGEVHFHNFSSQPTVDLALADIQAEARNLQNSRRVGQNLFATVDISGHPLPGASLKAHLLVDPLAARPSFNWDGELLTVPLEHLNPYLMAYAGFEVTGGQLDLYTKLASVNGYMQGYIKPIVHHTAVKVWSGHETKPSQYIVEPLVALLSLFMKNWSQDQFATTIPVSGNFDDPRLDSWTAFINLLKNAWVEAAKPGITSADTLTAGKKTPASPEVKPHPIPPSPYHR